MTVLLDGTKVAQSILEATKQRVQALVDKGAPTPCLATILVGDDPASVTYTGMKRRRCESVGMRSVKVELPASIDTQGLCQEIDKLASDPNCHGILLQHPSPPHIDERAAFERIPAIKDVDGVTYASFANQWFSEGGHASCTPAGMISLLDAYDVDLTGKHAVVIGRSAILGKPMAALMCERNATVTLCHSRTQDLPSVVKTADVVVAAVGKPEFVKGEWIRPGAIVLDAGYNPGNVGDVEYGAAAERASMITPVPGGVGPMTIATLIQQTCHAAETMFKG